MRRLQVTFFVPLWSLKTTCLHCFHKARLYVPVSGGLLLLALITRRPLSKAPAPPLMWRALSPTCQQGRRRGLVKNNFMLADPWRFSAQAVVVEGEVTPTGQTQIIGHVTFWFGDSTADPTSRRVYSQAGDPRHSPCTSAPATLLTPTVLVRTVAPNIRSGDVTGGSRQGYARRTTGRREESLSGNGLKPRVWMWQGWAGLGGSGVP